MSPLILNTLRVGIALQAIGIGIQYLGLFGNWDDDSPVFSLLVFDWRWPQETAQRIDDFGAWAYVACGALLVAIPLFVWCVQRIVNRDKPLLPVAAWQVPLCLVVLTCQLVLTLVTWYRGGSFMSEWTLANQTSRLALPIALIVLTPWTRGCDASRSTITVAMWILRVAASLTFLGHGLKAFYGSPRFVDFILSAAQQISWDVSQQAAESMLRVIGVVDLAVAALILCTRWRWVAFYMAAWAFIAAWARVVHSGWGAHYEVLVRAGNYCVPLALGIYFHLSCPNDPAASSSGEEPPNDATASS